MSKGIRNQFELSKYILEHLTQDNINKTKASRRTAIKLLQIEKPENSINLALCLKPVFSSMPVAYFIEFFDKTNKPELTGARAVGTAQYQQHSTSV
jgi:hypothetical protein